MPAIIVTFNPQVLVNGRYESAQPLGPTEFDATASILAMGKAHALDLRDDSRASDSLKDLPEAPAWIRAWEGPFSIEVQESIWQYFEN